MRYTGSIILGLKSSLSFAFIYALLVSIAVFFSWATNIQLISYGVSLLLVFLSCCISSYLFHRRKDRYYYTKELIWMIIFCIVWLSVINATSVFLTDRQSDIRLSLITTIVLVINHAIIITVSFALICRKMAVRH